MGKYLDGYYDIIEKDRQLEELESHTKMSKRYRRFLSFSHLSENMKSSEVSERLFNREKTKLFLTAALKSKSNLSNLEESETSFALDNLNNDMTISYISKLMVDEETPKNAFKKKKSTKNMSFRRVESLCENFGELKDIDFDSAIFKDVDDFDFSHYKLPKEGYLKEETMKRILQEREHKIDNRIQEISNKQDEMATKRILERTDVHNPFLKAHNLEEAMDNNEGKIDELLSKLKQNETEIAAEEKLEDYQPDYDLELESIAENEAYHDHIKQKVNLFGDLEKSICKLTRRTGDKDRGDGQLLPGLGG